MAPYCVKVFRQRWYVVARSLSDEQLRAYALDRIQELRTTENAFALPEDFDPQAYFADSVGVVVDEKCAVERVKIRVQGIQRQYIRTLPLHASQQEVETNEDSSSPAPNTRFSAGTADPCCQCGRRHRSVGTPMVARAHEKHRRGFVA